MISTISSVLFASVLAQSANAASWGLTDTIDSSNWLQKFNFYDGADPTNGHGLYVNQDIATSSGIAYSDADSFSIKVDQNTAFVDKRNTVRLESHATYTDGVYVMAVDHIPTGCAVWPAWWTLTDESRGVWPNGGEIDILEYFSGGIKNDLSTLHTTSSCTLTPGDMTGSAQGSTSCEGNVGCPISLPADTADTAINGAGGAVVVMSREFGSTGQGIRVWNFDTNNVPFDINSDSIDPSTFGTPAAHFARNDGCNNVFSPHKLVLNTALCGDAVTEDSGNYAAAGCAAQYGTCLSQVQNRGDTFGDAFWKVKTIKVYTNGGGSDKLN